MESYERLEDQFAAFNDLDPKGMVACSSGTAALHLALEVMQLQKGSKVLVPDFTMVACPRAVTMAGLEPVFVDCDDRLLMDPQLIGQACEGGHVRATMVVHIYGRQQDMGDLISAVNYHSVSSGRFPHAIIEDLAEAHGVKPCPATDAACWSFFKNKIIAGEEGGAVWFKDPEYAELARSLRCLGFDSRHDFRHRPRGWNHRMSNCHAGLILKSLGQCGKSMFVGGNLYKRRQIEHWYEEQCLAEWRMPKRDAVWVYDIRIPKLTPVKQDEIVYGLNKAGIASRHAFKPMSLQEEYRQCRVVSHNKEADVGFHAAGTEAAKASREVLYLPINPGKTSKEDCNRSFEIIQQILGEK